MCTLSNIEDPDEMLQNAASHQGLLCLQNLKQYLMMTSTRNILLKSKQGLSL